MGELVHVYDVRRLLEVEAARRGAQWITPEQTAEMQAEFDLMCAALAERRTVAYLDHDEALLTILYKAGRNPVLVELIRSQWSQCRAYKIVGAQASLDSSSVELRDTATPRAALFHATTVDAVPAILETLAGRGFHFVAVSRLRAAAAHHRRDLVGRRPGVRTVNDLIVG